MAPIITGSPWVKYIKFRRTLSIEAKTKYMHDSKLVGIQTKPKDLKNCP